jgi:hypothetical protein
VSRAAPGLDPEVRIEIVGAVMFGEHRDCPVCGDDATWCPYFPELHYLREERSA